MTAFVLLALLLTSCAMAQRPPPAPKINIVDGSLIVGSFVDLITSEDGGNLVDPPASGGNMNVFHRNTTTWSSLLWGSGGSISTIAVDSVNGDLYIGGQFSSIGGVTVNNIARFDGKTFYPLQQGLPPSGSGSVSSIVAINGTVFAGGSFTLTNTPPSNTPVFASNIAMYSQGQWQPMPYLGLNGPVNTLALVNGQLWASGSFYGTADADTSINNPQRPPDQLISPNAVSIVSNVNTTGNGISNILVNTVPNDGSSNCWIVNPYIPGLSIGASFTINLGESSSISRIRLANSRYNGGGTYTFTISGGFGAQSMTFYSPYTLTHTTNSVGQLPRNTSLPWTDFYFFNFETSTITFTVNQNYGTNAGLCGIQIYRSGLEVSVVDNAVGNQFGTTGTWTTSTTTTPSYISTTIGSSAPSFSASFGTFTSGLYDIYITSSNPCSGFGNCVSAGTLTVGSTSYPVTFTQSSMYLLNSSVPLTSGSPITVTLGGETNSTFSLTSIYLQHSQTVTTFNTKIASYTLSGNVPTALTQPVVGSSYPGPFSFMLLEPSNVTALVGPINGGLNIGRLFFANSSIVPVTSGFVGSEINAAAVLLNGTGYVVGGSFSKTLDSPLPLNNVGMFLNGAWTQLGQGTNGVVSSVAATLDGIYISGSFSLVYNTDDLNYGIVAKGFAVYNLTTGLWVPTPSITGSISVMWVNQTDIYVAGSVTSAFNNRVNGVAQYSAAKASWSSLGGGFSTTINPTWSITSTILYNNQIIIAGAFQSQSNAYNALKNIAFYNASGNIFAPLGAGVSNAGGSGGSVSTLATFNNALWVGGSFTGAYNFFNDIPTVPATGLAAWNGTSWFLPAPLLSSGGTVNVLYSPSTLGRGIIVVGGSFSSAGTVACRSICIWDGKVWSALGSGLTEANGATGTVKAIIHYNNILVVGGSFLYAGSIVVNNIAFWNLDDGHWLAIGPSTSPGIGGSANSVSALAIDTDLTSLFVGGNFQTDSNNPNLAKYNGNNFVFMGNLSTTSSVNALRVVSAANTIGNNWLSNGKVLLVTGKIILQSNPTNQYTSMIFDGYNWRPESIAGGVSIGAVVASSAIVDGPPPSSLPAWVIPVAVVLSFIVLVLIILLIVFVVRYLRNRPPSQPKPRKEPKQTQPVFNPPYNPAPTASPTASTSDYAIPIMTGAAVGAAAADRNSGYPAAAARNSAYPAAGDRNSAYPASSYAASDTRNSTYAMPPGPGQYIPMVEPPLPPPPVPVPVPAPTAAPQYRATQEFVAQGQGEVSLNKGEIVVILDSSNVDWWNGQLSDGRIGWFPRTFVEPIMDSRPVSTVNIPLTPASSQYTSGATLAQDQSRFSQATTLTPPGASRPVSALPPAPADYRASTASGFKDTW